MADLTGAAFKGLLTPRGLIIGFRLPIPTSPPDYLTPRSAFFGRPEA